MEISGSILSIKEKTKQIVKDFYNSGIDYIHIDVMDGLFVTNKSLEMIETKELTNQNQKLDVHLMVEDVKKYIDDYVKLNPEYITFHLEATNDILPLINLIKENNIKVGLSIKPNTDINLIVPHLKYLDLVLIMSVEPGKGGQEFIPSTLDRINFFYNYRNENNLNFKIEVDGGINDTTIKLLDKIDIAVVGSFITNGNYKDQVLKLKGE